MTSTGWNPWKMGPMEKAGKNVDDAVKDLKK
jgi:hypothetical protein